MCNPMAVPTNTATIFPMLVLGPATSLKAAPHDGEHWWFTIEVERGEAGTRLAVYARNVGDEKRIVDRYFVVTRAMVRGRVDATPAVIAFERSQSMSRMGPAAEYVSVLPGERLRLGWITVKHPAGAGPDDTLELGLRVRTLDARLVLAGDVVVPFLGR